MSTKRADKDPKHCVELTTRTVKAAQSRPGGYWILWDAKIPGFGLRVQASGIKTFVLQYRDAAGASRRLSLGRFGEITADQARAKAEIERGNVREHQRDPTKKLDPIAEKRKGRAVLAAARSAPTVSSLLAIFESEHLPKRKPATAVQFRSLVKHLPPDFLAMKIEAVKFADVAALHRKMRKVPIQANRVLALLSAAFNLARRLELRKAENPVRGIERYPERRRNERFSADELARLGEALRAVERDESELPGAVAAVRLLALTGARKGEILKARWSDLDSVAGTLRVVEHKTSRRRGPKVLILGKAALDALKARKLSEEWIIPGRGGALIGFARPWARILERAEIAGKSPHDLRRTFASVATDLGYPEGFVRDLLGHSATTTTAGYIVPGASPLRHAADSIAGAIDAMLRGERGEQVAKIYTFGSRPSA